MKKIISIILSLIFLVSVSVNTQAYYVYRTKNVNGEYKTVKIKTKPKKPTEKLNPPLIVNLGNDYKNNKRIDNSIKFTIDPINSNVCDWVRYYYAKSERDFSYYDKKVISYQVYLKEKGGKWKKKKTVKCSSNEVRWITLKKLKYTRYSIKIRIKIGKKISKFSKVRKIKLEKV